jgi:hypothetical protein
MVVASLVLGIIGTAAGLGALVWQVITWQLSGPVVTVDAAQGFPAYGPEVGDQVTIVTATNSGRAPVTVNSWGLRFPDGQKLVIPQPFPGSDALPHRLEPGSSGKWMVETIAVAETCQEHSVSYEELRAFVTLGNGRTISAREKGILLAAGYVRPKRSEGSG